MNKIPFLKMQATGNDFVMVDNRKGIVPDDEYGKLAKTVSHRKFGVGSDGLILLKESGIVGAELEMIYKNPDGSDAGMCGNGARCFVQMANRLGYKDEIKFHVHQNIYTGKKRNWDVNIHFPLETCPEILEIDGNPYLSVYTNTEHIVCLVDPSELSDESTLVKQGRKLRFHDQFSPVGTNVNFMHGLTEDELVLQTYERGVEDLTLACGTGAVASAIAWHYHQELPGGDYIIKVEASGGTLTVYFTFQSSNKTYNNIRLEGPAVIVFEGTYQF